jgi:two-component system, NarL family, response regulator DevR
MATPSLPIRVLLVDDHAVVRFGVRAILSDEPKVEVVGEASTASEALRLLPQTNPDVVILDIRLPDISGIELCRQVKSLPDAPKVLMLTSYGDEESVLNSLDAGADGYMLKDLEQGELGAAILAVARGGAVIDPVITRILVTNSCSGRRTPTPVAASPKNRLQMLTPQEQRVVALLSLGKVNKEISSELLLTEGTVRNMLTTIYSKLEVKNRAGAVALWLRHRQGP